MKYIKNFESIRDEYSGMFHSEPEEIESVPGFDDGTIDPDDNEDYEIDGIKYDSGTKEYKKFLKIVKERNFEETPTEIKVNLNRIGQDYCMSIYNYPKHLIKFLNDELIGKYVSDGFGNIMNDDNIEGVIKRVALTYHDSFHCSNHFTLRLIDVPNSEDNYCSSFITIDKTKSDANKYNL
jgi:hypothetical protein